MRKQHTKAQRRRLVRLVMVEGRTAREAAGELSVRPSTAYYWLRQAAKLTRPMEEPRAIESADQRAAPPAFARLVRAEALAPLELRVGHTEILVRPGFDAALLRAVVAALAEGAS